jgi:hypothetical protein
MAAAVLSGDEQKQRPGAGQKIRKAFEKVQQSGLFDKLRLKYLR